jgi:hypothetical protein
MPRAVRYLRTVELHYYLHEYNELKGDEQILSLWIANICIQIFRANKEQPSRMCQAKFVGSKSPHPRRPVPSVVEIPRFPPLIDLLSQVCKPSLPRGEAYGRSVIEQRSLSLNQNSNAEICLSSPPPVTHGPQFYTQPIVLNWRGPRGKASLPT